MTQDKKIEDVLKEKKVFVCTTAGQSMYPMLRNRRDTVIISACHGRLKKYDVALYKYHGYYVLHRVVMVYPDSYVICGDNCIKREHGITDGEILGVLTGFYRDEKSIDINSLTYKIYVRLWCALYPLRRLYRITRNQIKSTVLSDRGEEQGLGQ